MKEIELTPEASETDDLIRHTSEFRDKLRSDVHRPRYHFMAPWGWMNDINGAIFWKGRYHVFYQHLSWGGIYSAMRWGHASSVDLLHWVHHPIALTPSDDGYDKKGCWSGGAFVSKDGVPTVIYHGEPGGLCIASSEDDMLAHWTKHPENPVVSTVEVFGNGYEDTNYALDPCAWVEGDTYYALVGNYVPGVEGDGTNLFRSQDFVNWEKVGPFYRSKRQWTEPDEDCAVPDFFPLGDKHMLLFASHLLGTQYYLGKLQDNQFYPELHSRLNWPWGTIGGPRSLLDGNGRRIYFDWIREFRGRDREIASGWSGVMTLPRVLSLAENGTLLINPAPEIEMLRMNHRSHRNIQLDADSEVYVKDVQGDCLELAVEIKPQGAKKVGVKVRSSFDGAEYTTVVYDAQSGNLMVDVSHSSLDDSICFTPFRGDQSSKRLPEKARTLQAQEAPLDLARGEPLSLRLFLDRSVLEVFANGRQCITQRIYPHRPESVGVLFFSLGGSANIESLQAWDLASTYD